MDKFYATKRSHDIFISCFYFNRYILLKPLYIRLSSRGCFCNTVSFVNCRVHVRTNKPPIWCESQRRLVFIHFALIYSQSYVSVSLIDWLSLLCFCSIYFYLHFHLHSRTHSFVLSFRTERVNFSPNFLVCFRNSLTDLAIAFPISK